MLTRSLALALCFSGLTSLPAFASDVVEVIDVAPPPQVESEATLVQEPEPSEPVPEIEELKVEPEAQLEAVQTISDFEDEAPQVVNTVVLQGLNKVTGKILRLEGPLGVGLAFDRLNIIPHRCWKAPPDERPENAVLIEINEIKKDQEPLRLFIGWMYSSSPALSGIEHPVYDITVVDCEYRVGLGSEASATPTAVHADEPQKADKKAAKDTAKKLPEKKSKKK